MQKIIMGQPEKVFNAIKQGKKVGIFVLDEQNMPISLLSEIKPISVNYTSGQNSILEPCLKFIEKHLNQELKLHTLASVCDISESYLCRLFKSTYGISVNQYIIGQRMEKARQLLIETNEKIVKIAEEVGYMDCGYFNKLFKKCTGITPLSYRKKFREN